MGTLTLDNATPSFRTELVYMLGNRVDSGLTDARLDRWINMAYSHLTHPTVHRFHELQHESSITLATDDNEYGLDSTTLGYEINGVIGVYYLDSTSVSNTARKRKLSPRSIEWFDQRTLTTGEPSVYAVYGSNLYISPVPTSTQNSDLLRLRTWRKPADLSAITDVTVIPSVWDQVILMGARYMAELDLGYRELAEMSKQNYAQMINEFDDAFQFESEDWQQEVQIVGESYNQGY